MSSVLHHADAQRNGGDLSAGPPLLILVRRTMAVLASLCLATAALWLERAPLLSGLATMWTSSDAIVPADAVVVLGGGLDVRPFAAAEYYRSGMVRKVLLANVRASPSERLGVLPPHTELNRRMLIKLGVPPRAIETFGSELSSMLEEVEALREWVSMTGAAALIVPTEIFSSRRLRWALDRGLTGTGTRAYVPALDPHEYTGRDWWRHEQGLIAFQNEVIKYVYYRVKYGVRQADYPRSR